MCESYRLCFFFFCARLRITRRKRHTSFEVTHQATAEDIPVLVEMMHEFYAESNFDLDHTAAAKAFQTLLDQPSFGSIWLSLEGEAVTGYVILTVRFSMEFGTFDGFIDDLYVRPSARRKGFANDLLQALFFECDDRNLAALHVEVAPDNDPAKTLYKRFGMQPGLDEREKLTTSFSTQRSHF